MVILTREQLEERLAALHLASLELVGNLSLEDVLEKIVRLAREQVRARYAALGVLDERGKLVKFIPVGMTDTEIARMDHLPTGRGLIGAMNREPGTLRLAEIAHDPRSGGFPPNHPVMHSFLGVRICLGERLLGQIYLTDKEDFPEFTESDERVIETLAAYAAVALNNARLYEDVLHRDALLTQRNEDMALINAIAEALTCAQEMEDVLDQTLSRVMAHLDVEAGEIFLVEDGAQELRLALHRGEAADAFWTRDRFELGEGTIGLVAEKGMPLVSNALNKDMRFLRRAVVEAGFRCLACVPMTAPGKVVGVMSVATRHDRVIQERELALLSAIGTWAGIALENARLNRQARRLAVLEERERIGMDLHDGIIQSIYAVGLGLDYARMAIDEDPKLARVKIEQAIEGLNSTIRDLRTYILDLRPRQMRGEDLLESLRRLVDEFRVNGLENVMLVGPENGLSGLPISHATALFHIGQEAMANAAKHSRATQVTVHLWMAPGRVLLEISDNGQGFDLRKMSVTLGHGLSNMHTRAHKVGGDVEITSEPGEGTAVLAWVPLRRANDVTYQPE